LYAAKQAGRAQVWRVGLDGQPERIEALPPSAAPSAAPAPAASANPAPPAPSDRAGVADAAA
jgi:hypothetical protein